MNYHLASHQAAHTLLAFCLASIALALALFFPEPPPVYAAALTVTSLLDNTTNGDSVCTLREAITAAETNADFNECNATGYGADTITFGVAGTIVLSSTLPTITSSVGLTIDGGNVITISGNNAVQVFNVFGTGRLTLQNLAIRNGNAGSGDGGGISNNGELTITNSTVFSNTGNFGAGISSSGKLILANTSIYSNAGTMGGAIYSSGSFTLANSNIYSNSATNGAGIFTTGSIGLLTNVNLSYNHATNDGGGIRNYAGPSVLTVSNSNIFSNTAASGAGISNDYGMLFLQDSNLSSNSATSTGGGIYNAATMTMTGTSLYSNAATSGGGVFNSSSFTLTITNSTFHGNNATANGGAFFNFAGTLTMTNATLANNRAPTGSGGGIYRASGTVTLRSTIVANNTASAGANCFGAIASQGYNLDSANTCAFAATGDITNTNPLLGPLGNHGGPTLAMPLFIGSLAIDHIPNGTNGCDTTIKSDQRGYPRPININCDIGAVEGTFYPLYLPLILK